MDTTIFDELGQMQLALAGTLRAELLSVDSDGTLMVRCDRGNVFRCDILESAFSTTSVPTPGDRLIVMPPTASALGCVLGRVGRFAVRVGVTHQRHLAVLQDSNHGQAELLAVVGFSAGSRLLAGHR